MVDWSDVIDSGDTGAELGREVDPTIATADTGKPKNPVVPTWPSTDDATKAKDLSDQDKFLRRHNITGTLDERFKKALDAQEKQHEEELRIGLQQKADREASLAAIKRLQQPALPVLKDIPSAPPSSAYEFRNPFLAFQNPGVILATMASFFTRQPLTTAFNSAAEALKGFHEGDKEVVDKNIEKWKDSTEQAVKQNKLETDKYIELWNRYQNDYDRLIAEMQAHAAGYRDDMMLAQLRYGDPKEQWEMIDKRIKSGLEMEKSFAQVDEWHAKAEEAHTRAQMMAASGLTDEQIDFDVKQMLQGALLTEVEPNIGRGVQGDAKRTAINAEFTKQAKVLGLTAQDIIDRRNARAASKAGATAKGRAEGTYSTRLEMVSGNLEAAIPLAEEAAAKVGRTNWRVLNAAEQLGLSAISNPDLRAFQAANFGLAELWAKAMNPTGVMRIEDRNAAMNLLSTTDGPKAYAAVIAYLKQYVAREQGVIANMIAKTGKAPDHRITPLAKSAAEAATGGTATATTPAEPATPDASGWITDKDTGIKVRPVGSGTTAPSTPPATPAPPAPTTPLYDIPQF